MLKTFPFLTKYFLVPAATLVSLAYGFHQYVIATAISANEPTKIKMESIQEKVDRIDVTTRDIQKILMDRSKD